MGVVWKMKEDLSAPYPGFGFGALDAFDGYVSYRCLMSMRLAHEIADMRTLIDATATGLRITQDLGLGMMLWLTHFFPSEDWAVAQRRRSLATLDLMWREDGYFCREPDLRSGQVRLHQLRCFDRPAICASDGRTGAAAEQLF